ncbi:hypothetical protein CSOJ01_11503 [Colletotrichum sojae]|uniref:Uncharacterized protein n=1 Tax=Colletotrichum sojae TaxID=2175907 RepID=A0A8H6IXR4_9PEZI|nr:hypothetical protein CSOJ01_11503 [Colletotrichum sojae]
MLTYFKKKRALAVSPSRWQPAGPPRAARRALRLRTLTGAGSTACWWRRRHDQHGWEGRRKTRLPVASAPPQRVEAGVFTELQEAREDRLKAALGCYVHESWSIVPLAIYRALTCWSCCSDATARGSHRSKSSRRRSQARLVRWASLLSCDTDVVQRSSPEAW